jgi:C1A family cysteine protease
MRALLFACVGAKPLTEDSHRAAWADFKLEFKKTYETEADEAERFAVFKENRVYVKMYNEQHEDTELGINEFADMTHDEFKVHYMTGYTPKTEEQWSGLAYLGLHEYSGAELADSVDWTTKGAVTPVKNQGQCGSCWSFSATGSLEGAWEIATGKLVSISEQQLVDCSKPEGDQGCQGGLMDDAFKYMEQNGMCTEESYSYEAKNGKCHAKKCTVGVPKGSVTGYKDVAHGDMNAMMEAVSKGPVSVAIEADKSVFQLYKSGVMSSSACGQQLDHGVLVVGYGELDGKKYWKVKNSWGSSWGMEGFILLARGEPQNGECGLLTQPSYPVVKGAEEGELLI